MPTLLNLTQAAHRAGVGRNRLYRAIQDGRLRAELGGGPGKSTLVSLEALQAYCAAEGLSIADLTIPAPNGDTPSTALALTAADLQQAVAGLITPTLERVERSIDGMIERIVEQVTARLAERFALSPVERSAERSMIRPAPRTPPPSSTPRPRAPMRQRILDLVRLHPDGLSPAEITARLKSDTSLKDMVMKMHRDHLLVRVRPGHYAAADGK